MFDLWILENSSARKINESEDVTALKSWGQNVADNAEDVPEGWEMVIINPDMDEPCLILSEETGWKWEEFDKFISRA